MGQGVRGERGGEGRQASVTMETNCMLVRVSHRIVEEPGTSIRVNKSVSICSTS